MKNKTFYLLLIVVLLQLTNCRLFDWDPDLYKAKYELNAINKLSERDTMFIFIPPDTIIRGSGYMATIAQLFDPKEFVFETWFEEEVVKCDSVLIKEHATGKVKVWRKTDEFKADERNFYNISSWERGGKTWWHFIITKNDLE